MNIAISWRRSSFHLQFKMLLHPAYKIIDKDAYAFV